MGLVHSKSSEQLAPCTAVLMPLSSPTGSPVAFHGLKGLVKSGLQNKPACHLGICICILTSVLTLSVAILRKMDFSYCVCLGQIQSYT